MYSQSSQDYLPNSIFRIHFLLPLQFFNFAKSWEMVCFLQQMLEACLKDLECEGCEIQEFCKILSTVSPFYQQISKFKVLRQKKHSSKMLCYFSFCLVYQQLACMISCFCLVWLFTTLWAIACQTPLSLEFSRPEYWSGCHALLQGIFPSQGSNPHLLCLLHLQGGSLPLVSSGKP